MVSRIRFALAAALVVAAPAVRAVGQDATKPTPLAALVAELTKSNPDVLAAKSGAQAAAYRPRQVSSLPDPHVTVQEFNVGNPLPFAGYTTSNFAYLGVGAS